MSPGILPRTRMRSASVFRQWGSTMSRIRAIPARFAVCLFAIAASAAAVGASSSPLSTSVVAALADADRDVWRTDGRLTIWVFFDGKDLAGAALSRALAGAESALTDRTARRRAKMVPKGASLVDWSDLPVSPVRVAAVAATGAELRVRSRWLDAVSCLATATQVRAIAALPGVRRVSLVGRSTTLRADATRSLDIEALPTSDAWSLDYGASLATLEQINVPLVHERGYTGHGVLIGMLDTGFDVTHVAFSHLTVVAAHDFVNDDDIVADEPGDPIEQDSHGTKVLSAIAGFAPGHLVGPAYRASYVLAKAEQSGVEEPFEEDWWVAGIEWAETQGVDVVSSSLGYWQFHQFEELDGDTAPSTIAGDRAAAHGIVVCNACGNFRNTEYQHICAPADGDSVIAVGAVDSVGLCADFSSPGPSYDGRIKPDVTARGVRVPVVNPQDDVSYDATGGTSLSGPLVAGVAALLLERLPGLTPMQVRDALRETANHAGNPDNDYGWGIVDADAALRYWGPDIAHTPLGITDDTVGPYTIVSAITDRFDVDPSQAFLHYRINGGTWQTLALTHVSGTRFDGSIPGQPYVSLVEYYLEAGDNQGWVTTLPGRGPDAPYAFEVSPDTTPPMLTHAPLADMYIGLWPPLVTATATDDRGVDRVELRFHINDGDEQGPFSLPEGADSTYTLAFPLATGALQEDDRITYTLTAVDISLNGNATSTDPVAFTVFGAGDGLVLLIDDAPDGSASLIADRLAGLGYHLTWRGPSEVTASDLGYQALAILASGINLTPASDPALRALLAGWMADGGRLLVEGGEIGYRATHMGSFGTFAADVLHCSGWAGDCGGALTVPAGQDPHPLLQTPHAISLPLAIDCVDYDAQDCVTPAGDAVGALVPANFPAAAGLVVYDDNPKPEAVQLVYLPFALGSLADPDQAGDLIENAVVLLLAEELPATATIAGTARMSSESDNAGITVMAGSLTTTTTTDGSYLLGPLFAGTYVVTASHEGYTTLQTEVTLTSGQQLAGIDFLLPRTFTEQYRAQPIAPIPDGDPEGLTSIISVPPGGQHGFDSPILDVSIDIDLGHPSISQLAVTLTSPAGTQVTLHDHSGGETHNLHGNWPHTLTVDGPGSLDDVQGESIAGDWVLHVVDTIPTGAGTLYSWYLNCLMQLPPVGVVASALPAATCLAGNAPNPFNPRTTLRLELARPGPVELAIFDLRGRLLRHLVDGALPAGYHDVVWQGDDDAGRALSSGVYLARLRADGAVQSRKMLLVR